MSVTRTLSRSSLFSCQSMPLKKRAVQHHMNGGADDRAAHFLGKTPAREGKNTTDSPPMVSQTLLSTGHHNTCAPELCPGYPCCLSFTFFPLVVSSINVKYNFTAMQMTPIYTFLPNQTPPSHLPPLPVAFFH